MYLKLIIIALDALFLDKISTSPHDLTPDKGDRPYSEPVSILIILLQKFFRWMNFLFATTYISATTSGFCTPTWLSPFEFLLAVTSLAGCALRLWAFQTLGRLFTFQVGIRNNHKLIKTGPYKYLRHPSYTGSLTVMASQLLWWNYVIRVMCLSVAAASEKETFAVGSIVAILVEWMMHAGSLGAFMFGFAWIMRRIEIEERMLRENFGEEWGEYAETRKRLIPLVY
ncbi:hypothetical protein HK102_006011 [Quaeritorhiza haematococci]|nr:hypothetical protein HK102_006011 [Quaeritorhiza haematococci]